MCLQVWIRRKWCYLCRYGLLNNCVWIINRRVSQLGGHVGLGCKLRKLWFARLVWFWERFCISSVLVFCDVRQIYLAWIWCENFFEKLISWPPFFQSPAWTPDLKMDVFGRLAKYTDGKISNCQWWLDLRWMQKPCFGQLQYPPIRGSKVPQKVKLYDLDRLGHRLTFLFDTEYAFWCLLGLGLYLNSSEWSPSYLTPRIQF